MEGKKYQHIGRAERLEISILLGKGYSRRKIAVALERSHSSIVREVNGRLVDGVYQPLKAHQKAYVKRKYSKYQGMKIVQNNELEIYVREKLKQDYSPEQIAGRLKSVDIRLPYVSYEGIYKWLYSAYGQQLCLQLRMKKYNKRKRIKRGKSVREIIKNRTFISERPGIINERKRIGDFEVDRIESGKRTGSRSGLLVAVERVSRYTLATLTETRSPVENAQKLISLLTRMNVESLTYDNDVAFQKHEIINQELDSESYFCFPHHPWEKGTIENTNKLIRQYIPKSSDVGLQSATEISHFLELLNNRPRKCLNYQTPKEVALARHLFKES